MGEQKSYDKNNAPRKNVPAKTRRKNAVSVKLTAVLIVIALVIGAAAGFFIGRGTAPKPLEAEFAFPELDSWENANADALNALSGEWGDSAAWENAGTWENAGAWEDVGAWENGSEAFFGNDTTPAGFDESAENVVVAEFTGGQLMRNEVAAAYNELTAGYLFSGYTEAEIPESLLTDLMEDMAQQKILQAKAQELGVYELTDADEAEIAAQAESSLNEWIAVYRSLIDLTSGDEDTIIEETKAYLERNEGVSYDTLYAQISESLWAEKLYDAAVKDVKLENADVTALYNEKLESQKASFAAYPEVFESTQMRGETIVYNLDAYRAVRLLSVTPDEQGAAESATLIENEMAMLEGEISPEQAEKYQAELNQLYASAETAMQEIIHQLDGGASFSDMLAQYGEDLGMQDETLRETGYYVSESSLMWPKQMTDAACALKNPGDISEPFRMNGSVCILEYVGDVVPGEVPVEEVYDALAEEALSNRRAKVYEEQVNAWMTEAEIKYYPERMQ